jgi:competence protein ComEC
MIESAHLFRSWRERVAAALLILAILAASLAWRYHHYQKLTGQKYYHTTALVLNQYKKGSRTILKLRTPHFTFYTSSREDLKDLRDRKVAVMVIRTKRVPSFWDYLRGFYAVSYIKGVLPKDRRYRLKEAIAAQHQSRYAKELFGALFLATAISKDLRDRLSALGLSHLVAISGFHLGIIIAVVTFLVTFLLRPLWRRCCPYLHLHRFAAIAALCVALLYLLFVGEVPSLVRAFVLAAVGFWLFDRHVKILSFELLFWVVVLILALFPHFLFSIGFWFSVAGVFYIYLFLRLFGHLRGWRALMAFNVWMYLMMWPVVHAVFGAFTPWQLLSPLVSIAFVFFYPLSLLLHLGGLGGWLDGVVGILERDFAIYEVEVPLWLAGVWVALSLASVYKHRLILLALLLQVVWLVEQVA